MNNAVNESCDGVDNNCNGEIDEYVGDTYYSDGDEDGYGSEIISTLACNAPVDYVENSDDCDDANGDVNPGAVEVCDEIDNNCDGEVSEGLMRQYYIDVDKDNYGSSKIAVMKCALQDGYSSNSNDCDDANPNVYEMVNGLCVGSTTLQTIPPTIPPTISPTIPPTISPTIPPTTASTIPPTTPTIPPTIPFTTYYNDRDWDGYGDEKDKVLSRGEMPGYVTISGDCNDRNKTINPGAVEVCDGVDNNCNGAIDEGLVIDGGWGAWRDWTTCSALCGPGITSRMRGCNNPAPACGGNMCAGENNETEQCNLGSCAYLALTADRKQIGMGDAFNLNWSSEGVAYCNASGEWTGVKSSNGVERIIPSGYGSKTYTLSCYDASNKPAVSSSEDVMVVLDTDFDNNGCVEFKDFIAFAKHYNLQEGDEDWEEKYDLNHDGEVNFPDFIKFAKYFNYGKGGECEQKRSSKPAISYEQLNVCQNPGKEKCDKLDNDCDGKIDEGC